MKKIKKILSACLVIPVTVVLLFQSAVLLYSTKVYANTVQDIKIPIGYKPIYTISDLAGINSNPSGKYILMNDIDMTKETSPGGSWDKGNGWTPLDAFSGVFDGNGHRIIGMHIYGETEDNAALFSGIERQDYYDNYFYDDDEENSNSAVIRNLGILDCEIDIKIHINKNSYATHTYVGGIAGFNNGGTITNCYVSGKIKVCPDGLYGTKDYGNKTGGIVGTNDGIITNCYNAADIYALINNASYDDYDYYDHRTGGIAAINYKKIKGCYNIGKITHPTIQNSGSISTYTNYKYYDEDYYDNNNYYLNTSISINSENGLIGKQLTIEQMKHQSSFSGFNFNSTWMIDVLSSYPYPQLKSCPQVNIDKLELKNLPDKLIYLQGDKLDLSGSVLSITYENGTVTSVEVDKNMISGVNMDKTGKQTVVIKYLNKSSSFDIEILVDAKSIYFSGKYSNKKGAILNLSEYTATTPEEDERHEVATYQFDVPHVYNAYSGVLIKIGKNKYRSKKKGLIFKVYKKKVIVKVTNKKYDKDLKGTYKLIRHFYS